MSKVVNLISGPRNISTALMYSFAQRNDFLVVDEPYYGSYLKNASLTITHPSQDEIIENMQCNWDIVTSEINGFAKSSKVFVKGMAHHYLNERPQEILAWENIILIRHPRKLIASFSKVIENPTLKDIGIKKASELFLFLKANGKTPVIIDSDELMIHPENYLRKLCGTIDISFNERMLKWKKGGVSEDGLWAKHWYKNVHNTTGFVVQQSKPVNVPPHLGSLLAEALPYYETLKDHILLNN